MAKNQLNQPSSFDKAEVGNMIPDGTCGTYVALFDTEKKPIFDDIKGFPLGMFVTSFSYEDDEDDDDSGELVIETDNVEITNLPNLGYLMPLKLQWGWVYPNGTYKSSPVKTVVIKKHKVDFTTEGVKFTIEFASASFLLKSQPAKYGGNNKNMDFLTYLMNAANGIALPMTIADYEVTPYATRLNSFEKQQ